MFVYVRALSWVMHNDKLHRGLCKGVYIFQNIFMNVEDETFNGSIRKDKRLNYKMKWMNERQMKYIYTYRI